MKAQSKIVVYQLALIFVVAITGYALYSEQFDLKAVLYGGFISVTASIVMAVRLSQAVKSAQKGSKRGGFYVYLGVIERLLIAIALFGAGLMWFEMSPVYTMAGLVVGQVGFILGGFRVKE
ncbi:ATP synthase subunit I [Cycloclasticus sp.]|uniref:ATP synthase subunit I n=1 Tax=Cycloclasticus sp. TaxID=2024830 RepID=UPI000C0D0F3E|nr:ATP synthase subunit I [Cycloclasticus sp.]PHR47179.1 MAG: ATP synthase subunit I [Cycloclasticus sp.]